MFRSRSNKTSKAAKAVLNQDYFVDCHRTYSCIHCRAHLANHDELISKLFQGNHGRAYLFNKVVNVGCRQAVQRELLTGPHAVADIYCDRCHTTLGWKYEQAFVPSQKYKEGKYIIELVHMLKENDWDPTPHDAEELLSNYRNFIKNDFSMKMLGMAEKNIDSIRHDQCENRAFKRNDTNVNKYPNMSNNQEVDGCEVKQEDLNAKSDSALQDQIDAKVVAIDMSISNPSEDCPNLISDNSSKITSEILTSSSISANSPFGDSSETSSLPQAYIKINTNENIEEISLEPIERLQENRTQIDQQLD